MGMEMLSIDIGPITYIGSKLFYLLIYWRIPLFVIILKYVLLGLKLFIY